MADQPNVSGPLPLFLMRMIPSAGVTLPSAFAQGLSPTKHIPLSDGIRGTVETIAEIRKLVRQGMTDQLVNRTAIAIVHAAGIQQFDFAGEIRAIFEWVKHNIRFFRDPVDVEAVRTAREILTVRGGDCDCVNSVLLPALLMTIGAHTRLVTVSTDPQHPDTFSHIYSEAELPDGSWIPLDAARRNPAFGRGPQHYFRKRIWSLTENEHRDVSGLAGYGVLPIGKSRPMANLRTQPRLPRGVQGLVPKRRRRLGQDGIDWSSFIPQLIGTAGTATANIITAINRPSIPSYAINPATGQAVPVSPQGTLVASSVPGGAVVSAAGSIPTWLIYGGLGLAALLVLRK